MNANYRGKRTNEIKQINNIYLPASVIGVSNLEIRVSKHHYFIYLLHIIKKNDYN